MPKKKKAASKTSAKRTKKKVAAKKIKKTVKPIPPGFGTVTPYLVVRDAEKTIEFYRKAFGAQIKTVHRMPDGKVMHAALKIGDSMVLLNEEFPEWGALSPATTGQTSVTIHLYVKDVDAMFQRAVAAGATVQMPLMDAFWGDRYGQLVDPSGHKWSIGTHREDLTSAQIEIRAKAMTAQANAHKPPDATRAAE